MGEKLLSIKIEGMQCEGCAGTISYAFKSIGDVKHVEADVKSKSITVLFDPDLTTPDTLKQAIRNAGFRVH